MIVLMRLWDYSLTSSFSEALSCCQFSAWSCRLCVFNFSCLLLELIIHNMFPPTTKNYLYNQINVLIIMIFVKAMVMSF